MATSKLNPHSEEAERAVLAAILLDDSQVVTLRTMLTSEDFFLPAHVKIFDACLALSADQKPIDLRTLAAELDKRGALESLDVRGITGIAYLASLDVDLPDLGQLTTYAGIVREYATRRAVIDRTQRATLSAAHGDVSEVLAELKGDVEKMQLGLVTKSDLVPLGQCLSEALADVEGRRAASGDSGIIGVPTFIPAFDAMTEGLHPGQLIVLAARPGMGKSALAINIAANIAYRGLGCALVYSLEMRRDEIGHRILASEAKVQLAAIRAGKLDPDQRRRVKHVIEHSDDIRLAIDDYAGVRVDDIVARCHRYATRYYKPDLIVVDYLQLVTPDGHSDGRSTNRNDDVSRITRGLKLMAKTLDCPVLAMSQLSRVCEGRDDKRPILSDLRDSGAIEQDADVVLFLYRHHVYVKSHDPSEAELIIAKQRQGQTGTIDLKWNGSHTKFS